MSLNRTRFARQAGVSIVESLVALLVLSVGLLGIAGMFLDSVKNSRTALLRTQAVNSVSDMADRIRANIAAREAYDTTLNSGGEPAKNRCSAEGDDEGVNCSVVELAKDDLARWIESIRGDEDTPGLLPGTNYDDAATVQYVPPASANDPEEYIIRVRWLEPPSTVVSTNPATDQRYSYEARVLVIGREPVL